MAQDKQIRLNLWTPQGSLFNGDIDILTVKLPNGYKGVQKNIIPFVSNVEISTMYINQKGSKDYKIVAIDGGLIYAERDYVDIFSSGAVFKEDIDKTSLLSILSKTQKQLEQKKLDKKTKLDMEQLLKKTINKLKTVQDN